MYFSNLKDEYEKWEKEKGWKTNGISDYIENKQNINLSDHAYLTLQNDMAVFLLQKEQTRPGGIPSDFINQVFCKFRQSANASIACRLHKKELALRSLLLEVKSKEKKDMIKILLEDYETKLSKKIEGYLKKKGNRFYIRINKDNLEYLATEGQKEKDYYEDNISLYIKAVLEEYAEKPYVDRERIYYKELIDEIESAGKNEKMLKILLKSEQSGSQKNMIKYMKVFKITSDREHLYNYVVGLISDIEKASSNSKDPWIPGALRLTSIHDCKTLNKPASISTKKREKIR